MHDLRRRTQPGRRLLFGIFVISLLLSKTYSDGVISGGLEQFMSSTEGVIVIKTPGRCGFGDTQDIIQSLAGEYQDFVLGKYIQEKMNITGFLYNQVISEKSVYALGTNNQCHSSSLQNFCRGLFSQIKESAIDVNVHESAFLPPGVNKSYFQDKTNHRSAVPFSFWPVAIRMDHLERFLYENISLGCPPLAKDMEEEDSQGLPALLAKQVGLQERFAAFQDQLSSIKSRISTKVNFENMENVYREITLKSLDSELDGPVYNKMLDFYNLFMYAKYGNSQSQEILTNMVRPLVHLIIEKLELAAHSERDKISVFSVSDKLMAAFNSFMFGYSHQCYLDRVMNGEKSDKNFCLGQIKPSANLLLKVSTKQQKLKRTVIGYRNGNEISLCGFGAVDECPVPKYLRILKEKFKGVTHLECHPPVIIEISDPFDAVMSAGVLGLFMTLVFYLSRCSWYMITKKDLDFVAIASAIPKQAGPLDYEPTSGVEMSARPGIMEGDDPEASHLKRPHEPSL